MRRAGIAGLLLALCLSACAPYVAGAPIGQREEHYCVFVRDQVKAGSLPLDLALTHYAQCGPFEAPDE